MQAAKPRDQTVPWPQIEMVRVAENDLRAQLARSQLFQRALRHSLDRALRPHRHEDRRFDSLVRQMKARAAGAAQVCAEEFEPEGHNLILDGRPSFVRPL